MEILYIAVGMILTALLFGAYHLGTKQTAPDRPVKLTPKQEELQELNAGMDKLLNYNIGMAYKSLRREV